MTTKKFKITYVAHITFYWIVLIYNLVFLELFSKSLNLNKDDQHFAWPTFLGQSIRFSQVARPARAVVYFSLVIHSRSLEKGGEYRAFFGLSKAPTGSKFSFFSAGKPQQFLWWAPLFLTLSLRNTHFRIVFVKPSFS